MSYITTSKQGAIRTIMRRGAAFAVALLVTGTAACDEGQGPQGNGSMDAYVDDNSGGAAAQTSGGAFGHTGTFTGMAEVSIYSDANGWVSLGSPSAVNFSMQSTEEEQIAINAQVPVGTYTRVRFELSSAQALISAGSDVGGGVLSADVAVAVGGSDRSVIIDRTITPYTVEADSRAAVRMDMNSELWIDDGSVSAASAADAAVESATSVTLN